MLCRIVCALIENVIELRAFVDAFDSLINKCTLYIESHSLFPLLMVLFNSDIYTSRLYRRLFLNNVTIYGRIENIKNSLAMNGQFQNECYRFYPHKKTNKHLKPF